MSSSGLLITTSTVLDVTVTPGLDRKLFDAAAGERGDVADVLRLERARRVDLTLHLATFHRVEPERTPLDRRRSRLESADADRHGDDAEESDERCRCTSWSFWVGRA